MLSTNVLGNTAFSTRVRAMSRVGTLCGVFGIMLFSLGMTQVGSCLGPRPVACTAATAAADCASDHLCTTGTCGADGVCVFADVECPTGQECDTADGGCKTPCDAATAATDCDDLNACTDDACGADGYCADSTNNTAACDDLDACTENDACAEGVCAGTALVCDDELFCNGTETCDVATGCVAGTAPCVAVTESCNEDTDACDTVCTDDAGCDDGVFCNGAETCDLTDPANGVCAASTDPCVDNGVFCDGTESCDELTTACVSSGDPCAAGEICDETIAACTTGVACTVATEAVDCPDDLVFCNGTESCDAVALVCVSSGDPCVAPTTCNETTGVCDEPAGSSLRLTLGTDNLTGTAGTDTFDGSREVSGGNFFQTLNNADRLNGGGGTDTLNAQMDTVAGALVVTPASLQSIEVLDIEVVGVNGATLSLVNGDTSVTTVNTSNNQSALLVSNVPSVPTSVGITNTAVNFTLGVATTAMTGTTNEVSVELTNVTLGCTVTLQPMAAGSGYETINVTSSGTVPNVLTNLTDGNGNSWTTTNIDGAQDLTLPIPDTTLTTINATGFTGKLTLTVPAASGVQTITGGTGDDVINMGGTYTSADTINGGAGTDRLTLTNAEAILPTSTQSLVSNIEVIGLSTALNGTIGLTYFSATGVRFGVDMVGAGILNYAAGTNSLDLQNFASGGVALTANIAGTATTDVLNMTLGSTAFGNNFAGGAVTINGAETVNLLVQGGAGTFGGAFSITNTAASEALILTGAQAITFTGVVTADQLNASGMTGAATVTMTGGGGANSMTITGTANLDTLIGGTVADIITGGAGNDLIMNRLAGSSTAADVLVGGTGNDTFTLIGNADPGVAAVNYALAPRITDFTVGTAGATDLLQVSGTDTNYATAGAGATGLSKQATLLGLAAGNTMVIQSVAQNAAAAAAVANVSFIKLTTGVAFDTNVQTTFNTAIGTATVTTLVVAGVNLVSYYDTTNLRMVLLAVDSGVTLATGDTAGLMGTIDMTQADYNTFSATNMAVAQ